MAAYIESNIALYLPFDSSERLCLPAKNESIKGSLRELQYLIPDGYKIRLATQTDVPLLDGIEAAAGTIFTPGLK